MKWKATDLSRCESNHPSQCKNRLRTNYPQEGTAEKQSLSLCLLLYTLLFFFLVKIKQVQNQIFSWDLHQFSMWKISWKGRKEKLKLLFPLPPHWCYCFVLNTVLLQRLCKVLYRIPHWPTQNAVSSYLHQLQIRLCFVANKHSLARTPFLFSFFIFFF